ncbi:hypothetical protein AWENTII_007670 [Aspergillus wentii]
MGWAATKWRQNASNSCVADQLLAFSTWARYQKLVTSRNWPLFYLGSIIHLPRHRLDGSEFSRNQPQPVAVESTIGSIAILLVRLLWLLLISVVLFLFSLSPFAPVSKSHDRPEWDAGSSGTYHEEAGSL